MGNYDELHEIIGNLTRDGGSLRSKNEPSNIPSRSSSHPIQSNPVNLPQPTQMYGKSNWGLNVSHCAHPKPWQREVLRALQTGREDIYVLAGTGAGKTLPIICHYVNNVLNINAEQTRKMSKMDLMNTINNLILKPELFKKLLITVPTRALTSEYYKDFKEHFTNVVVQGLYVMMTNQLDSSGNPTSKINPYTLNTKSPNDPNNIYAHYARLADITLQHSRGNPHFAKLVSSFKYTLDQRRELITQYQTYTDRTTQQRISQSLKGIDEYLLNTLADIFKQFISDNLICLLHGAERRGDPKKALVIITVYESAKNVSSIYKNLSNLVIDEAHHMQRSVNTQDDNRNERIALTLYSILTSIPKDCPAVYMSGTESQASAELYAQFSKRCLKRRVRVLNVGSGNTATFNIQAADWIDDDRALSNLIKNPKNPNQLIVLFSKARIQRLRDLVLKDAKMSTSAAVDAGHLGRYKHESKFEPKQNTELNPFLNAELMDKINKIPGAEGLHKLSNDPENKLLQSVLSGFGYIYNMDNEIDNSEKRLASENMQIISKLFSDGKIHTLLATDAVGIGLNINVKDLYIPTIEKMIDSEPTQIANAPLCQLINRAGRASFKFANIYTPSKFVPTIATILSMGEKGFDTNLNIKDWGSVGCSRMFRLFWRLTNL